MSIGNPHRWVIQLPRPLYPVVRFLYRAGRELTRLPFWVYRLVEYRLSKRPPGLPVVGLHTVFIAKENILFLKEWILYHRAKGIEHFFLYDNTGSRRAAPVDENNPHLLHERVNKYGVPYDEIVRLSDAEIQEILNEIQIEIPNVRIVRWQPRDDDGSIIYAQVEALNEVLARYGELVDWMVFMDMDEFVVSDEFIPELCRWLESWGYDGGLMEDRPMPTRLDNLDCYVTKTNLGYGGPYRVAPKYMCDIRRVLHANVHNFRSRGRQYRFDPRRLFFLHYKMPSRHPDMRDRFAEVDTGISSDLMDHVRLSAGEHCSPEWRLGAVHPDWRRIMGEVYPWWHLEECTPATSRQESPHGRVNRGDPGSTDLWGRS